MWRICLVIFNEREVVLELYLKRVRNCCCDLVGQSDSSTLSVVVSWSLHYSANGVVKSWTPGGWVPSLNVLHMVSVVMLIALFVLASGQF